MNVNDMVSAMAAKTVDAMVNVEPYNAIAEADGLANTVEEFYSFDKLPVFMAATPEFVDKNPDTIVAYLKAWLEVDKDFKNNPDKVAETIYTFYTSKGYKMSKDTFHKAIAGWRSIPARRPTSSPICSNRPKSCSRPRRSRPSRTGTRRCARTSSRRPAPDVFASPSPRAPGRAQAAWGWNE